MLMIGLTIFTVASLFAGLATSATMLLLMRGLQGVGAAMAAPSSVESDQRDLRRGSRAQPGTGIFTAVSAGGGSLGLILGGALTSWCPGVR